MILRIPDIIKPELHRSVQKLDFFQDPNGNGLVVFPDHPAQTKDINEPPKEKPSKGDPEEKVHPNLAEVKIMPTGKNPQKHEGHECRFLLLSEFRKECLLSQLIHAGELAKHCFRELVSDVVGYVDHADDLPPNTQLQLGRRLGKIVSPFDDSTRNHLVHQVLLPQKYLRLAIRRGHSTGLPVKAEYKGHVWTWDFICDGTTRGGALRMLTILDEYTRECHVLRADRALKSGDVLE